jgi:hypothetical protein
MRRTLFAVAYTVLLSGCVSSQYQRVGLDNIFIADVVGVQPYTEAVNLTPPDIATQTVPITRFIIIAMLVKPETDWLQAFNFDGDNFLDEGEITQGWLIKTAQLLTGKTYAPDSLRMMGKSAASEISQVAMVKLRGVELSQFDQRRIRASLNAANSPSVDTLVWSFDTAIKEYGVDSVDKSAIGAGRGHN